ncbi:type IV pilin N-terminal domain-containing protein [Methanomethylovorans sp.]|uniref:type IV pilin N-terminal domain-containing protein n=1 Tax=Methanomethylovorans sp. TaxID=2758717 RepID=UPI00345E4F7F
MSPVIGVMLMLVVTVILAAAVSSTSSGLMKSTDKAPTAVFDVKLSLGDDAVGMPGVTTDSLSIKQVTGDSIPTSDLKIITVNPNTNGVQTIETVPGVINHRTGWAANGAPWLNDGSWSPAAFGNYTLKSGIVMVADSWSNYNNPNATTWNETAGLYDGFDYSTGEIDALHSMIANYDSIEEGDWVTIKIVHMPTQKVIFQSDVEAK